MTFRPAISRLLNLARRLGHALLPVAAAALVALPAARAAAAEGDVVVASEPAPTVSLHVPLDKAAPLTLPADAATVVVAQPGIAKAELTGSRSLYVQGLETGATNLLVYGPGARLLQVVNVDVGYDARQLQDDLAASLPTEAIRAQDLGQAVLLTGQASSSEAAATAEALAQRAAPDAVVSHLDVRPSQVLLEVRIVEASSSQLRDIGLALGATDKAHLTLGAGSGVLGPEAPQSTFRLHATPGRYDLDARLQALEQRGTMHILARPTLATLAGEVARFQAGGEFPYAVPQSGGKVTVEYRPYGTALAFRPDVQANGFIRLQLAAEVSAIDTSVGVRLNGVSVPGLSTRRVATTADLRDGETMVMAGMLSDDTLIQEERPPWLRRLGDLLGSHRAKAAHRELAILVTPRLATGPPPELPPELAQADQPEPMDPALKPRPRLPHPRAIVAELRAIAHAGVDLSRRGWTAVRGVAQRLFASGTHPPNSVVT